MPNDEEEMKKLKEEDYRKWYYKKNKAKIAEYQRRYYLRKKGYNPNYPLKWRGTKGDFSVKQGEFIIHFE